MDEKLKRGEYFRKHLEAAGYTVTTLSAKMGIDSSAVSKWKGGTIPNKENLEIASKILDINPYAWMQGEDLTLENSAEFIAKIEEMKEQLNEVQKEKDQLEEDNKKAFQMILNLQDGLKMQKTVSNEHDNLLISMGGVLLIVLAMMLSNSEKEIIKISLFQQVTNVMIFCVGILTTAFGIVSLLVDWFKVHFRKEHADRN